MDWMLASPSRPIRVLIVDDHGIVRVGIGRLLDASPGIEVVGLACDGEEAIERAAECEPDVVLMDLQMPGLDGIAATQAIAGDDDAPRVVVLTSFSDRRRITEAFDSGAAGYLLKDSDPDELLAGIRAAAEGAAPLAPRVAMTIVEERRSGGAAETMSDREREVFRLRGEGRSPKEIADRLGVSVKTVGSYDARIKEKLGLVDAGELMREAVLWHDRQRGLEDRFTP